MLDKKKIQEIKEKLEKEKEMLLSQLRDIGKLNPETNEWEAIPEERDSRDSDQNDMADRFEDFESRSVMTKTLESRLNDILSALEGIKKGGFGKCEVCKGEIEADRMEVNPAARTCKKHLDS